MHIVIRRSRQKLALGLAAALMIMAVATVTVLLTRFAAAAPATIAVTTTVDEDSHPVAGTGCSIYEASIAANTGAAYGGCTAGDLIEGSVINVPVGTYPAAVDGFGYRDAIELSNTSLVGAGTSTILQAYRFIMSGDSAAQLSNYVLGMVPSTPSVDTLFVSMTGDNKTFSNVRLESTNPADFYFDVYIGEGGEVSLDNIVIDTLISQAGIGGVNIVCQADLCLDTTIQNVTLSTLFDARIDLLAATNATLDTIDMTAEYTGRINIGTDATASNLIYNATTDNSSARLDMAGASTITTVIMNDFSPSGVEMRLDGAAASLTDIRLFGNGNLDNSNVGVYVDTPATSDFELAGYSVSIFNYATTGVFTDVSISADEGGSYLYVDVPSISRVLSATTGGGTSYLYNDADAAVVIDDVVFEELQPSVFSSVFSIGSTESVTIGNVELRLLTDTTAVTIGAPIVVIDGMYATNAMVQVSGSADTTLTNLTLEGSPVFNLLFSGNSGDTIIENSYLSGAEGGVVISTSGDPTDSLTIRNTQFENMRGTFGPKAIHSTGINSVVIESVTVADIPSPSFNDASIHIIGGTDHAIRNTTISDGVGSLYFEQVATNPQMLVELRHISVFNSGVGPSYAVPGSAPALQTVSGDVDGILVGVANSFIVGDADYTACDIDANTVLSLTTSTASSASCIAEGFDSFTGDPDVFVSNNLSDDTAEGPALGFGTSPRFLQTIALPAGSPAIGAGDPLVCLERDARHVVRDVNNGCDLGAYAFTVVVAPVDEEEETGGETPAPTTEEVPARNDSQSGNTSGGPVTTGSIAENDDDLPTNDDDDTESTPQPIINTPSPSLKESTDSQAGPPISLLFIGGIIIAVIIAGIVTVRIMQSRR